MNREGHDGKRPWQILKSCADFCMDRLTANEGRLSQGNLALCMVRELHPSFQHRDGPGSSVGIVTGYGLDGPGMESRWGRDFPHMSRPALWSTQPPVQLVPCLSPGVKSGRGVTLTPYPFLCRGQERVELYLYASYGPYGLYRASVPVQGCT